MADSFSHLNISVNMLDSNSSSQVLALHGRNASNILEVFDPLSQRHMNMLSLLEHNESSVWVL